MFLFYVFLLIVMIENKECVDTFNEFSYFLYGYFIIQMCDYTYI